MSITSPAAKPRIVAPNGVAAVNSSSVPAAPWKAAVRPLATAPAANSTAPAPIASVPVPLIGPNTPSAPPLAVERAGDAQRRVDAAIADDLPVAADIGRARQPGHGADAERAGGGQVDRAAGKLDRAGEDPAVEEQSAPSVSTPTTRVSVAVIPPKPPTGSMVAVLTNFGGPAGVWPVVRSIQSAGARACCRRPRDSGRPRRRVSERGRGGGRRRTGPREASCQGGNPAGSRRQA